jgi:ubiquinone/menaquinone biosynthesis C-methylase UbiE
MRTSSRLLSFAVAATVSLPALASAQNGSLATSRIFEALALRSGATVCEIGAGDGALSLAAADIVGAKGRVYTSELGTGRLKALRTKVGAADRAQVEVVAGETERTNFPDGACDALFMRNVYHHFADPAAMTASVAAALKPGGRVAVVDFRPPGDEAASPADRDNDGTHGVTADTVTRELQAAGFVPIATERGTGRWFMVVATKPAP